MSLACPEPTYKWALISIWLDLVNQAGDLALPTMLLGLPLLGRIVFMLTIIVEGLFAGPAR